MRLGRKCGLGAVLCFLALSACDRLGENSTSDIPPATSYRVDEFALSSDGISQTRRGASVTTAFFQAAKSRPWLGRLFTPEEYQSGKHQTVVLSHRFWQQRFKGDPASIGRAVRLNGRDLTIVGVMPPAFKVPSGVDVWLPNVEPAR